MFLGALALRPQLVGVGPLLPEIDEDLGVSHAVAGLLGTIPVLCMGLFAPPAAYVAARLGTRGVIGACLAGIAAFGIARAVAPAPLVLALTFPIGVGMGPRAPCCRWRSRSASPTVRRFASGVYTTGITTGSALSSALAVPIAAAWGGRHSHGLLGLHDSLFAGWLFFTPGGREPVQSEPPPRLPWGRRVVWGLAAVFALQSIVYYGLVSWMPDSSRSAAGATSPPARAAGSDERGRSAQQAARPLPGRPRRLPPPVADAHGGCALVATVGIAALPGGGFAWATLAGLGIGATFPLTMTLPLDVARNPADTGAVVGLMLGAGYTITAVGPILLGAVRDATGSFSASLWVLVAVAAGFVASVLPLSPAAPARAPAARSRRGGPVSLEPVFLSCALTGG